MRPVIIAGFGALGASESILELAEKIDAPIVATFRGKGIVDNDHPLYMGCHGSIGTAAASEAVRRSDLLIVVGASYSDLTQIPGKRTVQVDFDPLMIARRHPVEAGLTGNSSMVIPALIPWSMRRGGMSTLMSLEDLRKSGSGSLNQRQTLRLSL